MIEKKFKKVLLYSLVASLGGLLFGFDIAIFSGTIPFIGPKFHLSPSQLGWIASCLYIGCAIGALLFGKVAEYLGRKFSLYLIAIIFIISSIFMGLAQNINHLVFWRIVAGLSVGGASIISPLYIAEISPLEVRGKMVSLNQLAIVIGILLAYFSNYYLANLDQSWRLMFISGCIPASLFIILGFILPESPKWLFFNNNENKGLKSLRRLFNEDHAHYEFLEIKQLQSINKNNSKKSFTSLFTNEKYSYLLFLAIIIAIFQQISGANAVLFYAPIIFEKIGMNVNDQLFIQILIGSINLIFTLVAIKFVDRIGRKKLMLIGTSLMATLLILIGISFQGNYLPQQLVSLFVLLFIGIYAATLAPVTWVIISEIFPINIREQGMGIASGFLWIACFSITYIFPIMINSISTLETFLIFSGLCTLFFFFILFLVPETKNNSV